MIWIALGLTTLGTVLCFRGMFSDKIERSKLLMILGALFLLFAITTIFVKKSHLDRELDDCRSQKVETTETGPISLVPKPLRPGHINSY